VAPLAPALFAISGLTRNLAKSTVSGGASLPNANPSPPPNCSSAEPAPPSTTGNGNQPTAGPFLSFALAANVEGAHWPIRSIAARPLPIVAASPPAPSHGAARWPSWNGSMSISRLSSAPALTKPSLSNEPSSPACAIASLPAIRIERLAHQNIPGHLSFSPTASGVMPADLSLPTSSRNSSQVSGGASMPAFLKSALLYQTPTMPKLNGTPYCLPSIW
jgi:hypothetical protein